MIIILIIFIIILFFLVKNKIEKFLVYRECGKSKRMNELNYDDLDTDVKISVVPYNEVMKQEPKEDEIELKKIITDCDGKKTVTFGFDIKDINEKLDEDTSKVIIDTMGKKIKKKIVNNIKIVPLLLNEINSFLKYNFDNKDFTKDIDIRLANLDIKTTELYKWYIDEGDFGDDTYEKNPCQEDHQCTGGSHLPERDQGGKCVNGRCKCKERWLGKKCNKRPNKTQEEIMKENERLEQEQEEKERKERLEQEEKEKK